MKLMLLVAVGLFIVLLLYRFIWGVIAGRRISAGHSCFEGQSQDSELAEILQNASSGGKTRDALREIQRRAHSVDNISRAEYHCAAGSLAVSELKRPSLAVGFYLRALREDPNCVVALDQLRDILTAQKRYKRFERTCWEILGRLGDDEVGSEMWVKCWSGLAAIYSTNPKMVRRTDAIRKLLLAVVDDDDENIGAEISVLQESSQATPQV